MSLDSASATENSDNEGAAGGAPKAQKTKPKHSPAFLVKEMSTPAFIKAMRNQGVSTVAKILPSGKQRIQCAYEDREKVRNWLTENHVEGQTNTSNDDRIGVALVKGIHYDYDPEFVKKELEKVLKGTLKAVRRFQVNRKEGVKPLHWWVVHTETRTEMIKVRQISTFNCSPIIWEQYKSSGPVRCFKCQAFGHLAKNCLNKPRCSRCSHTHAINDCKKPAPTKEDTTTRYYCVNCKSKGHWAGALNCPSRIAAQAADEERETRRKASRPPPPPVRRAMQRVPTAEDFVISGKNARGAPAPSTTSTAAPRWGADPVSTNEGSPWAYISKESDRLFGKTTNPAADEEGCITGELCADR